MGIDNHGRYAPLAPLGRYGFRRGSPGSGFLSDWRSLDVDGSEYSRATTASLADESRLPGVSRVSAAARLSPPGYSDAIKQQRWPSGASRTLRPGSSDLHDARTPRPSHMQLFVLGYERDKESNSSANETQRAQRTQRTLQDDRVRQRVHSTHSTAGEAAMEVAAATARARAVALRRARELAVDKESESETDDDGILEMDAIPADESPDAFANAMRLPVRIGQVLSVLCADARTGVWSRRRAAFAVAVSGGLSAIAILSAVDQLRQGHTTLVHFMVVVFYTMTATMSWLFIRLARSWGTLLRAFRAQERVHGACPGLRSKLNLITSLLLGVAFVEHSLAEANSVINLRLTYPDASTFGECLEIYVKANYSMVVFLLGYWPPLAPFLFFLNFTAAFLWNFTDLFIMLMGVAVAARFKCLSESISKAIGSSERTTGAKASAERPQVLGTAYWRTARLSFNSLSNLTRLVDRALNIQLLVSFVNNLYFVCMQLLRGFDDPNAKLHEKGYILFSFGLLVARTSAVSLYAAAVHENSRTMRDVLYCVCSEDYNEEVQRFMVQVTSEMVALSGCNMFKLTRGLLLTVAGTILTYEVVLVQLH